MKMHPFKRLVSLLLIAALLAGFYVPAAEAASTGLSWKEIDQKGTLDRQHSKLENNVEVSYTPTEIVRVSIVLEEKPTVQAGFPTRNIAQNTGAMAYSRQLRQKQDALAQSISTQVLNGQKLDVAWNLTLAANLISANVPYGKIDAIARVEGVKAVVLETRYSPCEADREEAAQPQMYASLGMTGASLTWTDGFTGAGSRIAVIDTGTDIYHQSMDNGAYLYALEQNAEAAGVSVDAYVKSLDLLDVQEIAAVLPHLNFYQRCPEYTAADLYLNEKLPFGANYVDYNLVVDHMSDYQGSHGSHVAGIAAANRYIPSGGEYVDALESVQMAGIAPDAQLITMKVFGNAPGPYDSDYMAAVEDAIYLGCDAVNLSLGSGNPGSSFNPYFSELLDYMTATDTVVVASAGNSYSWPAASYYGYLYSDDVSLATGGAPGSYANFFTVASVENDGGMDNSQYGTMSDFSSWGVPGDLSLKPEITAPGGNIFSLNGMSSEHNQYEWMSGTSMAAPAVTGLSALVAQYLRERGIAEAEGLSVRKLTQSLLMSTATPIREEESGGNYYSLMKQGAGLARADLATLADSYILVDGQPDGKVKAELGDDPDRTGVYKFRFSINNITGEEKTYTLSADVFRQDQFEHQAGSGIFLLDTWTADLPAVASFTVNGIPVAAESDLSAYDFNSDGVTNAQDADYLLEYLLGNQTTINGNGDVNGDGVTNTYDAHILLTKLSSTDGVTVPANGSVTVDVRLELTASGRQILETNYPNGTYVEAFVYAESSGSEEGTVGTRHSIPVLAFYGNWSDASMFDRGTAVEYLNNAINLVPYLYDINGTNSNTLTINYGDGEEYIFGGNPYLADETYLPERNAFNNTGSAMLANQHFTLIRNASDLALVISNTDTGEIYISQQLGSYDSAYYHVNIGSWQNTRYRIGLGWQGTDARGNLLPEGTNVEISLVAVPEYYLKADGSYDYEALGKGAYLTTQFTIDNTAPKVTNMNLDGSVLTVEGLDNRHVAAVVLMNGAGTIQLAAAAPNQLRANTPVSATLDLTNIPGENFILGICDYADNWTTYSIELDLPEVDRPYFTAIDRTNVNPDETLNYVGFDSNGSYFDLAQSIDRNSPRVAEYVEGYVFEVTDDKKLYVASDKDLLTFTELGMLDPDNEWKITGFNDLAYNKADGKLYGSFYSELNSLSAPYLCTIDMFSGVITVLGEMPIDANTMAIDGEGNFYSTIYGASQLYTYASDVCTTENTRLVGYLNGYSTMQVSSLAWDHNTGTLYWACTGGDETTLLNVDPTTGSTAVVNSFPFCMAGLYIAYEVEEDIFAPVDTVDSIALEGPNTLWVNSTAQFSAKVRPWNVSDPNVTWSSSDTSVATVDGNGLVRGIRKGSAVITATSVLDPRKSASMTVNVTSLSKNLKGVVWDEEGSVWWSQFNTDMLPNYTKLAQAENNVPLTTTAVVEGTLYASSLNTSQGYSTLYTVDPATFAMTKVGDSSIAYLDMAYGPGTGYLFATYFNYIVLVDTQTGDYMGAWDWSEGVASDLVGITYYGSEYNTSYQAMIDYFLILDSDGNVYLEAFLYTDSQTGYFNGPEYGFVTNMGDPVDYSYFQGFYYDGTYVYWARFNENDNIVQLILWDYDNSGIKHTLGHFPEGVWPAGGLYCDADLSGTRATLAGNSLKTASVRSDALMTAIPDADLAAFRNTSAAGGTNAAQVQSSGSYESDQEQIVVTLTPPYAAANGRMTLSFDASGLNLVSVSANTEAFAYKHSNGTVEIAYAGMEDLSADAAVATLVFEVRKPGEHKIRVLHTEAGTDALNKEEVLTFTSDCQHNYQPLVTEPTCEAGGYTTYTCTLCGDSYVGEYTDPVDHSYEDGRCKWCGKEQSYAKFSSISTSLGGNIAMNFYVELSEDLVADPDAYIQFTFGGKTIHVPLSEGVASGNNVYRFACPITSKNMTDDITAQVFNASGAVGASKTMSVDTYCNWVIENVKDAKTVNLMKAMLNYGASAQMLFNYRTDDLANAALSAADKTFGKVDASAFAHSRTGEEDGIKPVSYTLLLDSETTVRCYFQLTGTKTIDQFTFTVDGIKVEPVYKDGYYYIEKANIAAHRLDDMHAFTCGNITITYGGLSYVNQVMTYYTSGTTFDMASALYAYSKAAEAYIG